MYLFFAGIQQNKSVVRRAEQLRVLNCLFSMVGPIETKQPLHSDRKPSLRKAVGTDFSKGRRSYVESWRSCKLLEWMTSTNIQTHKPTNIQTYKPTNIQTYKHTNIQTYKQTNIQTYKQTHTRTLSLSLSLWHSVFLFFIHFPSPLFSPLFHRFCFVLFQNSTQTLFA